MQIKDVFSRVYKIVFDTTVYVVIVATIFGLLPQSLFNGKFDFQPERFENEHLYAGIGQMKWNNDLVEKGELLLSNQIVGGESFASIDNYLYTSLADGRVIRINKLNDKVEDFIKFNDNKQCLPGLYTKLNECGRPLGLREHPDGSLFVAEANTGLYRVNITTREKKHLKLNMDQKSSIVFNDLVFDPVDSNIVYFTISTTRWGLDRLAYSIFEHDDSGYVMAANIQTGEAFVLTAGHYMPNGIEITPDGKYLLFALTGEYSIKKIAMDDIRKSYGSGGVQIDVSKVTLFGNLLPGEPDNIRVDKSTGDILVGMFTTRSSTKLARDYLGNWPKVRKSLARSMFLISVGLIVINDNFPNAVIEQLAFDFYSGHIMYKILPSQDGAVFKLCSKTGKIKKILGSTEFNSVSEAIVDENGDLYYGSFRNKFIGRIRKGSH